jgi:hypothetical protein
MDSVSLQTITGFIICYHHEIVYTFLPSDLLNISGYFSTAQYCNRGSCGNCHVSSGEG